MTNARISAYKHAIDVRQEDAACVRLAPINLEELYRSSLTANFLYRLHAESRLVSEPVSGYTRSSQGHFYWHIELKELDVYRWVSWS